MGGLINSMVDASIPKEFKSNALMILNRKVEVINDPILPKQIIFAGGCFWGMQLAFQRVLGVLSTEVGYTQGLVTSINPSYEDVMTGKTGHIEAVQVTFDSNVISLKELLDFYWDIIDPTSLNGQGTDVGTQYRSGIYCDNEEQYQIILNSRESKQTHMDLMIVTEVINRYSSANKSANLSWYPAEAFHQRYLEKGGQSASKGDCTAIRCYGLPYSPMRFDRVARKILSKRIDADATTTSTTIQDITSPAIITFSGGCFWGMQLAFQRVLGVLSTEVGYTQGLVTSINPSYEDVMTGKTGHIEAVQVTFDSNVISLKELLDFYWDIIDPTSLNGQGTDVGTQYRSGIYYNNEEQYQIILKSKTRIQNLYSQPIAIEVLLVSTWYVAEEFFQRYLEKDGQSARKGDLTPIRQYG